MYYPPSNHYDDHHSRYDPYRRPEFYDPYMPPRGAPSMPPHQRYYHPSNKFSHHSGIFIIH